MEKWISTKKYQLQYRTRKLQLEDAARKLKMEHGMPAPVKPETLHTPILRTDFAASKIYCDVFKGRRRRRQRKVNNGHHGYFTKHTHYDINLKRRQGINRQ